MFHHAVPVMDVDGDQIAVATLAVTGDDPRGEGQIRGVRRAVEQGEGAEQVVGGVVLVGVADELGVELLVAGKGDATGLPVVIL